MKEELKGNEGLSDRVKRILRNKRLTLHQVSERSAQLYGRRSLSYIPHNVYYALRSSEFSPSLLQLCALSRISGYRLDDWLTLFGFGLEKIPSLQVLLPSKRTILLDALPDGSHAWIPWFHDVAGSNSPIGLVPLGRLLTLSGHRRLDSLLSPNHPRYLYAKIGLEDALAYPDLLPGSIVRVDSRVPTDLVTRGSGSGRIFLIDHNKGVWCSRLHFSAENQICPISNQLPYARVELEIPAEAQILGLVDMEIRRISKAKSPDVPVELARQWRPRQWSQRETELGGLLRSARTRAALSFREASSLSRSIADLFGDEHYFAAHGSLSDYETRTVPPRHIQKVITLCAIYGVSFDAFLIASGVKLEELGQDWITTKAQPERGKVSDEAQDLFEAQSNPVLNSLMSQFGELPFFLRGSLPELSGGKEASLHDFFWMGEGNHSLHPYLRDGLLLIVNRRAKKLCRIRSMPMWQQPLHVLMTRDGKYLCAVCSLENGVLVVNLFSENSHRPLLLRNRRDAEVIGQVVTLVRRIA